jgi:acyl-coenzyme A synthetase/AMP-(fatty) acid ligase
VDGSASTASTFTRTGPVHPLVAAVRAVAAAHPDYPAIESRAASTTYRQLVDNVTGTAAALRANGLAPGQTVSLLARRDRWLSVALMAVWEVGAVAAIIDSTLPARRVTTCEQVVAPRWRLTMDPRGQAVVDRVSPRAVDADGASHILFTSGTTGRPAAVVIGPEAIAGALRWYVAELVPARCRVGLLSGLGHDPVMRDIFAPLLVAGTLVVPPPEVLATPVALASFVAGARLTVLHATPALLEYLLAGSAGFGSASADLGALALVVSGGAALRLGVVRRLRDLTAARMVNGYGTTETPQLVSCEVVSSHPEVTDIGVPDDEVMGVGTGVMGAELLLLPPDRPGTAGVREVVVCSPYLAVGYAGGSGRPERFIADPRGRPQLRAFRTGDLGVRTADGGVRVVGRLDREVSINGYRVALEEIEHIVLAHAPVAQAHARLVTGPVDDYLALSVVLGKDGGITPARLRSVLSSHLPAYAVPRRISIVDSLPVGFKYTVTTGPARYRVVEQSMDTPPVEWDRLAQPREVDLGSSRVWNLLMAGIDGAEVAVRVARSAPSGGQTADSGPVRAVLPVFRYGGRPQHPGLDPAELFMAASAHMDRSPRAWEPVTLLGSMAGSVTSPAASDVEAWLAAVYDLSVQDGATVMVPYLADQVAATIWQLLPEAELLLTGARAVLEVRHRSREAYEASLPRRKRADVRYERKLLRRGGRSVGIEPLTPAVIEEVAFLQANTQRRHGSYPSTVDDFVERYQRLATSPLAQAVVTFVCRHRGRAVGYVSGLVRDRMFLVYGAGLDYERTGSYAEYFNLLIHAPVDYCLLHGLRGVDLGPGGLRQKLLRGGRPDLIWSLIIRAPAEWSPSASRLHNRSRAALMRRSLGRYLAAAVVDRLDRMAATGVADFGSTPRWWPGQTTDSADDQ